MAHHSKSPNSLINVQLEPKTISVTAHYPKKTKAHMSEGPLFLKCTLYLVSNCRLLSHQGPGPESMYTSLLFLLLYLHRRKTNQRLHIRQCTWVRNDISNVKADQQGRGEAGNHTLARYETIAPNVKTPVV